MNVGFLDVAIVVLMSFLRIAVIGCARCYPLWHAGGLLEAAGLLASTGQEALGSRLGFAHIGSTRGSRFVALFDFGRKQLFFACLFPGHL